MQLACLALLWAVKAIKQISILFPVMLIVMVLVRKLIEKIFTEEELNHLDDKMPEIRRRKKEDKKQEQVSAEPSFRSHTQTLFYKRRRT